MRNRTGYPALLVAKIFPCTMEFFLKFQLIIENFKTFINNIENNNFDEYLEKELIE